MILQPEGLRQFGGDVLGFDAQPAADDVAVFHQLLHYRLGDGGRNGETDAL